MCRRNCCFLNELVAITVRSQSESQKTVKGSEGLVVRLVVTIMFTPRFLKAGEPELLDLATRASEAKVETEIGLDIASTLVQ